MVTASSDRGGGERQRCGRLGGTREKVPRLCMAMIITLMHKLDGCSLVAFPVDRLDRLDVNAHCHYGSDTMQRTLLYTNIKSERGVYQGLYEIKAAVWFEAE